MYGSIYEPPYKHVTPFGHGAYEVDLGSGFNSAREDEFEAWKRMMRPGSTMAPTSPVLRGGGGPRQPHMYIPDEADQLLDLANQLMTPQYTREFSRQGFGPAAGGPKVSPENMAAAESALKMQAAIEADNEMKDRERLADEVMRRAQPQNPNNTISYRGKTLRVGGPEDPVDTPNERRILREGGYDAPEPEPVDPMRLLDARNKILAAITEAEQGYARDEAKNKERLDERKLLDDLGTGAGAGALRGDRYQSGAMQAGRGYIDSLRQQLKMIDSMLFPQQQQPSPGATQDAMQPSGDPHAGMSPAEAAASLLGITRPAAATPSPGVVAGAPSPNTTYDALTNGMSEDEIRKMLLERFMAGRNG